LQLRGHVSHQTPVSVHEWCQGGRDGQKIGLLSTQLLPPFRALPSLHAVLLAPPLSLFVIPAQLVDTLKQRVHDILEHTVGLVDHVERILRHAGLCICQV
jgi:hypothetical protein